MTDVDVYKAISPLLEEDVDKFSDLIEALKAIGNNQSSKSTTKILNKVEKYINRWLTNRKINGIKSSQEESAKVLQDLSKWLQHGFDIHTEINSLSLNRKQELIALGYFLQGELSTEEEFEYIRRVLRSYLATIRQFRSPRPPNS